MVPISRAHAEGQALTDPRDDCRCRALSHRAAPAPPTKTINPAASSASPTTCRLTGSRPNAVSSAPRLRPT